MIIKIPYTDFQLKNNNIFKLYGESTADILYNGISYECLYISIYKVEHISSSSQYGNCHLYTDSGGYKVPMNPEDLVKYINSQLNIPSVNDMFKALIHAD